jgi:hypothetical protein
MQEWTGVLALYYSHSPEINRWVIIYFTPWGSNVLEQLKRAPYFPVSYCNACCCNKYKSRAFSIYSEFPDIMNNYTIFYQIEIRHKVEKGYNCLKQ